MTAEHVPIAIVGMAVLLPGAPDLASYWENLVSGVDSITDVPEHRWDSAFYDADAAHGPARADRIYCRRGGFVDSFATVDPTQFGIMPNSVAGTEPDQLIALRVAAAAISDAGGRDRLPSQDRVGVILGRGGYLSPGMVRLDQRVRTAAQLVRVLGELMPELAPAQLDRIKTVYTDQLGPNQPESAIGLVPNLAASRIANRLDLRGPAYTVDAACASSLIAVDHAVRELVSERCDAVLAGGVHHCHDITFWSVFTQLRALSPSQRIRPFDQRADGILIGEGTGAVVLKRLADAERDGDRIYAVIRGTGVSSDGRSTSLFSPEPDGQILAVERAWRVAGLTPTAPDSIGMLEAHGTATPAGDQAELATLRRVFGEATGATPAVIGSVKSMIGHTMPAAGIAGLVKAALAVHRGVLLPTLHCEEPHSALAATRFHTIGSAQPWETATGQPRRAAVNAFGFGGINAHVVIEQAPSTMDDAGPVTIVAEPEQVLRLTAESPQALARILANDDDSIRAESLDDDRRTVAGCRLGIVGPTAKRLALARKVVATGAAWRGRNDVWFSPAPLLSGEPEAKIAFVFSGLEAEFQPRVDDVADHFGLSRLGLSPGSADVGRHGAAVVTVGRVLDKALRLLNIQPAAVAGHSVGEWTAMMAGNMYSGKAVDEFLAAFDPDSLCVPDVAFATFGCGADRVATALGSRSDVTLSHDNSPNQSVVCGPAAAVDELARSLREQHVLGQVLPFRSGFHTPMMEPYLEPIVASAATFEIHQPSVPVWSATTASPYPPTEAGVRELFVRHLLEPVRFRPLIEAMYAAGFRVFVHVGTGQLASLISDTLRDKEHLAIAANSPHRAGLNQLLRVATAVWVEGGEPNTAALNTTRPEVAMPKPRQPLQLDLGSGLISLNGNARNLIGTARSHDSLTELERLAPQFPLATQLGGLLRDTADIAASVINAGTRVPTIAEPRTVSSVMRMSTKTMPYLMDHCILSQRDGWPDESDRWPVVPATTLVDLMMRAAEEASNGQRAVAVHDVRLARWLAVAPPVDVTVTTTPQGPGLFKVEFGQYAQSIVEVSGRHPAAPTPWAVRTADERVPDIKAEQLYTDRWMFHGPEFQGVTELTAIADSHVRGVITAPAAPGALLDNVGQLLGYWIMATHTVKRMVFPVGMRSIRFFGGTPAPGTPLECTIRIRSVDDTMLTADVQLSHKDRVWAEISGWQDRRFDNHPETTAVERFAQRNALSHRQQGGWFLACERWPDLASRDLFMRRHLGAAERVDYDQCSPRERRQWLLGRIALKDAVRNLLWDHGFGDLFPAEIAVHDDESGLPTVTGAHGNALPEMAVSLGYCRELGVAIVRSHQLDVGIDIAEITEHTDSLHDSENAMLTRLTTESGEHKALWLTRFRTAKRAVSKVDGADPRVLTASETSLTVLAQQRVYTVHCREISNPEDLPARQYVVAWTEGPNEQEPSNAGK